MYHTKPEDLSFPDRAVDNSTKDQVPDQRLDYDELISRRVREPLDLVISSNSSRENNGNGELITHLTRLIKKQVYLLVSSLSHPPAAC